MRAEVPEQPEVEPSHGCESNLIDDIPPHIKTLYDRPQDEWGADEWRVMALYLFDEMQAARRSASEAYASATEAYGFLREVAKIAVGPVLCGLRSPTKQPGRPKIERSSESAALERQELIQLAQSLGPSKAAEQLAMMKLEACGERLPHAKGRYERYLKTWKNKIAAARRAEVGWLFAKHGRSLALAGALLRAGLDQRRRRKK